MIKIVKVDHIEIGGNNPLVLIAGPCVIESENLVRKTMEELRKITSEINIPFIFKSSYDKANRTSIKSYRGPGLKEGLEILHKVKGEFDIPLLIDVHQIEEVEAVSKVADILQVPAFLCRQTDLIISIARAGKPVNVKKGQFLAPWDMKNIIEKIESTGNKHILLTERGSCFGYNNLVVDMKSLPIMRSFGYPVIFDATHSVQKPGGRGTATGGEREYVPFLAQAAVATGIDGLFLEVHPVPEEALSDGANMIRLDRVKELLKKLIKIDRVVKITHQE
jgi:2-dehydro-3-deoxyphosphooctonate aldolase (KDO 8-P synthase)